MIFDQITYNLLSTLLILILGIIWSKTGLMNIFLKIVLIGIGIFGILISLNSLGYIIKL